ncbi:MAG: hypothetical protein H6765_08870 [Candidatus Peribacteria bacterium]|nr:MAG: hypothetical protein H6765_08870 [Candidatus Peribacteria bacterium]
MAFEFMPGVTIKDTLSFIAPGVYDDYWNVNLPNVGDEGTHIEGLTQIGGDLGHIGSDNTTIGLYSSSTCAAVAGGYNVLNLNPAVAGTNGANIMYKYKNGVLTNEPLWPWSMDQRIYNALAREGMPAFTVTDTIF